MLIVATTSKRQTVISIFSRLYKWLAANSYAEFAEVRAFPHELAVVSRATVVRLSSGQKHPPSSDTFQVNLRGEALSIPYRVYYDKEQLIKCIGCRGPEQIVALCLASRHCDGYMREKCVKELLLRDEYWVVPFIVQLLGEYVVEITVHVEKFLKRADDNEYTNFLHENTKYVEKLERRAISYWNEYYRQQYPKLDEYPATRAIRTLKRRHIASR